MANKPLVTQPTLSPMRKIWASGAATIVFASVMGALSHFYPEVVPFIDVESLNLAITTLIFAIPGLISTASAYIAKEWGDVTPSEEPPTEQ
jgi:hypothetical protein